MNPEGWYEEDGRRPAGPPRSDGEQPVNWIDTFNANVESGATAVGSGISVVVRAVKTTFIAGLFLAAFVGGIVASVALSRSGGGWWGLVYAAIAGVVIMVGFSIAVTNIGEIWPDDRRMAPPHVSPAPAWTRTSERLGYLVAFGYALLVLIVWAAV